MTTPAYAIAYLQDVDLGPAIGDYLTRIDDTLAPYGGRFLVHGGELDAVEGSWPGTVVVIGFPDQEAAHAWYRSPAYQEILPLRLEHSRSIAAIVPGVPEGYRAADQVEALLGG